MAVDTRVPDYRPDAAQIRAWAELMVLTLRDNGVPDSEIVGRYAQRAVARADAEFERMQRREFGCVPAPAAMVRREMCAVVGVQA